MVLKIDKAGRKYNEEKKESDEKEPGKDQSHKEESEHAESADQKNDKETGKEQETAKQTENEQSKEQKDNSTKQKDERTESSTSTDSIHSQCVSLAQQLEAETPLLPESLQSSSRLPFTFTSLFTCPLAAHSEPSAQASYPLLLLSHALIQRGNSARSALQKAAQKDEALSFTAEALKASMQHTASRIVVAQQAVQTLTSRK